MLNQAIFRNRYADQPYGQAMRRPAEQVSARITNKSFTYM